MKRVVVIAVLVVAGVAVARARWQDEFDHEEHARLFVTCLSCHEGISERGAPVYPTAADCSSCHDGETEEEIDWTPPHAPPRTNLKFDHRAHADSLAAANREPAACQDCHAASGETWMAVQLASVPQCLDCHGVEAGHFAAPDTACVTCHVPLAEATRLDETDVRAFSVPPSHDEPGFAGAGHGELAWREDPSATAGSVAPSCAVCHAREFCIQCHVDAPVQPAIQQLAPDRRSLVFERSTEEPDDHADDEFLARHAEAFRNDASSCRTCHTQESCRACHVGQPDIAPTLLPAGPDRGAGAQIARAPPPGHTPEFVDLGHGVEAAASSRTCAACHVQPDCLSCHRRDPGGADRYHPADFLTRHPAAAYARETSCADCHNPARFCTSCHAGAGLRSQRPLTGGYHDAAGAFIVGHGEAARQYLETCTTCHVENDCLACHSAIRGRRFNPHGPGFDADRLRRRNATMCTVCHGAAIPTGQ